MKLSIVVVFFNMQREAARTLYSLSPAYQRGVAADDYEIIAIDNGSSQPLDPTSVEGSAPNVRYIFRETSSVSPVGAVNLGADMAQGEALAVIVDGARMASPGLVRESLDALRRNPSAFICTLAWHLGPDIQPRTIQDGYDQQREDAMLRNANWRADGYRLFDIATIAPSSRAALSGTFPGECSWFCMSRYKFDDLGGFNPAFRTPGGGLCNHEFRNRALCCDEVVPTVLLGEGVFHQVHGGAATNALPDRRPHKSFAEEYRGIFGTACQPVEHTGTIFVGSLPDTVQLGDKP